MTKNPQKEKERKGLSAKINPGINVIHLKTYQVLSYKLLYTNTCKEPTINSTNETVVQKQRSATCGTMIKAVSAV